MPERAIIYNRKYNNSKRKKRSIGYFKASSVKLVDCQVNGDRKKIQNKLKLGKQNYYFKRLQSKFLLNIKQQADESN